MADSVGTLTLADCGSDPGCPAATYSFDIGANTATLTIAIDPNATITAGVNDTIAGVNLGFSGASSLTNLGFSSNPAGSWSTIVSGSLSNSGCGNNNGSFICASGTGVTIVAGDTYTFTWTWDNAIDPDAIDSSSVHIGTNYNPANGLIVSCTTAECGGTSVPEPGSLTLLGAGLLALAGLARLRL